MSLSDIWRRLRPFIWLASLTAHPAVAAPGDPPAYAGVFKDAFKPGFRVEETVKNADGTTRQQTTAFRVINAADLIVKSGRVAAADPFVSLTDMTPFTQTVPNGTFPVRLAVGDHIAANGVKDNRVAFARIDFSNNPIVRWQLAVRPGQTPADLKDDQIFGYGVDAGTGAFFDPLASKAAAALLDANPDAWQDWQRQGEAIGPKVIGPYAFLFNLPLGDVNVVMFHSGWGDGYYASWFGFDAAGNVVALVTDFATIDWENARR